MFSEYLLLLTKIDIYSSKNDLVKNKNRLKVDGGWTNHRLFGSINNKEICESNNGRVIQSKDD